MNRRLEITQEFHKKFGGTGLQTPSLDLSDDFKEFRIRLMKEEFDEMCASLRENDLQNFSKECADLMITLCGTIVECGYHHIFDQVLEEVHGSNMSKTPADDGRKALKKEGYFKADVTQFFN